MSPVADLGHLLPPLNAPGQLNMGNGQGFIVRLLPLPGMACKDRGAMG